MFSDLLENLFNIDEQIRSSAEQTIIRLRDDDPDQYIQELINIITPPADEQNLIQPKIQHASIVLLGQAIKNCDLDASFFENLSTLLLHKLNSENYDLSYSSAVLFGESLGFLVRDKNHPDALEQLIEILQTEVDSIQTSNPEDDESFLNLKFLLISVISFLEFTDLESDETIPLFQILYQLFQTDHLTNEVLQVISFMMEELADTFNQFSSPLSFNDENQPFIDLIFDFNSQLLEKATTNEEIKVFGYNCFRLFFKYVSFTFYHENLDKVLELVYNDLATSTDESVLISSIRFLKTVVRREQKMRSDTSINFTPFFDFSHFDTFLMPLIRVFAMLSENEEDNLEYDYDEIQTPHLIAKEMILIFTDFFNEHAPKMLIPLIISLSTENCDSEQSIAMSFSCFDTNFEMESFVAIETSLFLLSLIINFSTTLPEIDFIVSFIGTTLSSPSVRIRCASVRALRSYLYRELDHIESENETDSELHSEVENATENLNELNEIAQILATLIPELENHILDEHPIISRYSMCCISYFSNIPICYDSISSESIFPLFLSIIESNHDYELTSYAFKYFERIIKNREPIEVATLIEPFTEFLNESNNRNVNSDYNDNLRAFIIAIAQKVTDLALPFHDFIYSLLIDNIDNIDSKNLIYLAMFSNIFDNNSPIFFQQTVESILRVLTESESINDDFNLRNEIVYNCCLSILVISHGLNSENVERTTSLMYEIISKDESNLNILIGLSAICLNRSDEVDELLPTLFQIISQININELVENKLRNEMNYNDDNIEVDDVITAIVNIASACYNIEPENQEISDFIIETLVSINSIHNCSETVLEAAIDLLLSLDDNFLLETEKQSTFINDIMKKANNFDSLKECVNDLNQKIKDCYNNS